MDSWMKAVFDAADQMHFADVKAYGDYVHNQFFGGPKQGFTEKQQWIPTKPLPEQRWHPTKVIDMDLINGVYYGLTQCK